MNHAQIDILGEKIVDSFAGGGGTSTGIELAAGRVVLSMLGDEGQTPTILQPTCNDVATNVASYKPLIIEQLRELVQADREGRCVVLPCKVGDKVFQQNGVDIFESQVKKIIYDCGHFAFDEETIGERVFLTRESAEAALKGEQA